MHPSAQYVPHAGHTHTRWRRSIVHTHDTERSDGRPGPSTVQRWPRGHPGGGMSSYPRGVRRHRDHSTSGIEQVYEWFWLSGGARAIPTEEGPRS